MKIYSWTVKSMKCLVGSALLTLALASRSEAQGVKVEYAHLDAIGNVIAVSNSAGVEIESHDYLPFGEEWCGTAVCGAVKPGQSRRFTGKERDAETGLDYFGARYYGSKVGRFTTVDPLFNWRENLVDPQRWNRYAYVRNNPFRYVDPDGKDLIDAVLGSVNSFGSNLVFGVARATPYNPDYAAGQRVGDFASQAVGAFEILVGSTIQAGGGTLVLTGGGASVGVPAVSAGMGIAAHGTGVLTSGTIHLSSNNRTPDIRATKGEKRTLEGALDQRESIAKAQAKKRASGQGEDIASIKGSEQREKNALKQIKNLSDVQKEQ